jgi:hypothetical protein
VNAVDVTELAPRAHATELGPRHHPIGQKHEPGPIEHRDQLAEAKDQDHLPFLHVDPHELDEHGDDREQRSADHESSEQQRVVVQRHRSLRT